jgi:TPR repeat protein
MTWHCFLLRRLPALMILAVLGLTAAGGPADAQTRRAFLVGNDRYQDGLQPLTRAVRDATDIARDLEDVGFDKKNIKLVSNVRTKADFLKELTAFANTIQEGDIVFFFFAGHGYGSPDKRNYLLMGDIRSPLEFTRSKVDAKDRRNQAVVGAKLPEFLDDYANVEVPDRGVLETEIQERLAARKPRYTVMVIDACRSLMNAATRGLAKDASTFGGLVSRADAVLPSGFITLYSASHGQDAVESFGTDDTDPNALFTRVLRRHLTRPGVPMTLMATRVRDEVERLADERGRAQRPEIADRTRNEFYLIASIGADRNEYTGNQCDRAEAHWADVQRTPRLDLILAHIRFFGDCATAAQAEALLRNRQHGSFASADMERRTRTGSRPLNPCDELAASEHDQARPSDVPGVVFDSIDADRAIAACEKSISDNERVVRYQFNLARALHRKAALATEPRLAFETYQRALRAYNQSSARGYVAAFNNQAILYDGGLGVEKDEKTATDFFRRGAQQGHALAMLNLAYRFRGGTGGAPRSAEQAFEWFARAAEAGLPTAMIEVGDALQLGRGVTPANPRRAAEWYQRASDAGSTIAKSRLGHLYFFGKWVDDPLRNVANDRQLGLIWLARAAEAGDNRAQMTVARTLEERSVVPNSQLDSAERYWRLAANGGSAEAQVEFADRLRTGRILVRPEQVEDEIVGLLESAMAVGEPRAALLMARVRRGGEDAVGTGIQVEPDPEKAVLFAYRAINLSATAVFNNASTDPMHEFAAGILLVEMGRRGEAIDANGRRMIEPEELDRLERYYGRFDSAAGRVNVRRIAVPLYCGGDQQRPTGSWRVWIWDWDRDESPTEAQFRHYEETIDCKPEPVLRQAINKAFETARKNKVSFPDYLIQQAEAAQAENQARGQKPERGRP